jgi:hypothetical protein
MMALTSVSKSTVPFGVYSVPLPLVVVAKAVPSSCGPIELFV